MFNLNIIILTNQESRLKMRLLFKICMRFIKKKETMKLNFKLDSSGVIFYLE